MISKFVITGPECSGKSTLAEALAKNYNCFLVKEFARNFLDQLDRSYNYYDLLNIAKNQYANEKKMEKMSEKILICDTSIHTIKIWSHDKFNKCDPKIYDIKENYKHYFICSPDIPWQYDPLRENPKDRNRIFNIYLEELKNKPFTIIKGPISKRIENAQKIINQYL